MAARCARLLDGDSLEYRKLRLELLPDPDGEVLRGGVLETLDLVQEVMIEQVYQGSGNSLQIAEVDEPSRMRINLTSDRQFSTERVTVHSPALVAIREIREKVCSFESKVLRQLNDIRHHGHYVPALPSLTAAVFSLVRHNVCSKPVG